MMSRMLSIGLICLTITQTRVFAEADGSGPGSPTIPDEHFFTADQKALVGTVALGLTPDVLAAAGVSSEQASQILSSATQVQAFDQLVSQAREIDVSRLASAPAQEHHEAATMVSLASTNENRPASERASPLLSASTLLTAFATAAAVPCLSTTHPEIRRPASTSLVALLALAMSQPDRHSSGNKSILRVPHSNAEYEADARQRFTVLQKRLREDCLGMLTDKQRANIDSCIQAVNDGLPPEFGLACATQQERIRVRDSLATEKYAVLLNRPVPREHTDRLRQVRSRREFVEAKSNREHNARAIGATLHSPLSKHDSDK